jgi:hypothetical protein
MRFGCHRVFPQCSIFRCCSLRRSSPRTFSQAALCVLAYLCNIVWFGILVGIVKVKARPGTFYECKTP